ncbi:hypothetical protein X798_05636 [Onchocerca flexuosa]|uniref:Uncharacterized protein n=1 Tax=Onchocerca flexuosa TaxID=387005 RepID=A0A238BR27_9BILA|nr:hypothetical protein X798_05636 [Onchocerca flexuosa]
MNSEKNANYLERARALAECSSVPSSINVSPAQQQKSEKFSKVNFTVNPQQYDRVGYKRVEDITEKNNHCMRHQIRFVDASTQLSQYRCCCNLMHAVSLHIILCIMVVLIIIIFAAASYGTFRQIFGYYMKIRLSDTFIVIFVISSVVLFLILSIMQLWQVTIVYSCMMYFEHKRYLEHEQCHPMIVKYNCSHGKVDEDLNIYPSHFLPNHKCYESCSSV